VYPTDYGDGISGIPGIPVTLAFIPLRAIVRQRFFCSGAPMSRIGRFVVPDLPHHVTHCENVFFGDDDTALYRDLLHEACRREGVACWAYRLMPKRVHLILTPQTPEGLGRALGKAHRHYSAFVNARCG